VKPITIPLAAALVAIAPIAFADGKACDLTSADELQATIGVKPNLKGSALANGVEVCTGKAGLSTVTIRVYPKKDDAEQEKAETKLEALEKAGATIDKRSVGRINCLSLRPGGKAMRQAYTTSCTTPSTSRAPKFAVVEVSNPTQSLEMRKLAALAQSIAERLF